MGSRSSSAARAAPIAHPVQLPSAIEDEAEDAVEEAAQADTIVVEQRDPAPAAEQEPAVRREPVRTIPHPGPEATGERLAFATHRPPPANRKAERQELAAANSKGKAEVSTGFVLGVALIVVALIGGIMTTRLGKRVRALENRLARIENAQPAP